MVKAPERLDLLELHHREEIHKQQIHEIDVMEHQHLRIILDFLNMQIKHTDEMIQVNYQNCAPEVAKTIKSIVTLRQNIKYRIITALATEAERADLDLRTYAKAKANNTELEWDETRLTQIRKLCLELIEKISAETKELDRLLADLKKRDVVAIKADWNKTLQLCQDQANLIKRLQSFYK